MEPVEVAELLRAFGLQYLTRDAIRPLGSGLQHTAHLAGDLVSAAGYRRPDRRHPRRIGGQLGGFCVRSTGWSPTWSTSIFPAPASGERMRRGYRAIGNLFTAAQQAAVERFLTAAPAALAEYHHRRAAGRPADQGAVLRQMQSAGGPPVRLRASQAGIPGAGTGRAGSALRLIDMAVIRPWPPAAGLW